MRRLPRRGEPHAEAAARRRAQPQIRRLAVDQESRFRGDAIGGLRAVAAAFLAADKHQADARLAFRAQPLGGGDLRGENAFRIARTAPIERAVLDAAGKERRHAVEVGREDDVRFADRRDDVDSRNQAISVCSWWVTGDASGCSSTE